MLYCRPRVENVGPVARMECFSCWGVMGLRRRIPPCLDLLLPGWSALRKLRSSQPEASSPSGAGLISQKTVLKGFGSLQGPRDTENPEEFPNYHGICGQDPPALLSRLRALGSVRSVRNRTGEHVAL